jgi:hypothetical protein
MTGMTFFRAIVDNTFVRQLSCVKLHYTFAVSSGNDQSYPIVRKKVLPAMLLAKPGKSGPPHSFAEASACMASGGPYRGKNNVRTEHGRADTQVGPYNNITEKFFPACSNIAQGGWNFFWGGGQHKGPCELRIVKHI